MWASFLVFPGNPLPRMPAPHLEHKLHVNSMCRYKCPAAARRTGLCHFQAPNKQSFLKPKILLETETCFWRERKVPTLHSQRPRTTGGPELELEKGWKADRQLHGAMFLPRETELKNSNNARAPWGKYFSAYVSGAAALLSRTQKSDHSVVVQP